MEPVDRHQLEADASFDGGDLDCGNGLLLLIRQHMDPLERGQLLEFRSTEISVEEDFPAWCRLTGNELVSLVRHGKERSFLVCSASRWARFSWSWPRRGRERSTSSPSCPLTAGWGSVSSTRSTTASKRSTRSSPAESAR